MPAVSPPSSSFTQFFRRKGGGGRGSSGGGHSSHSGGSSGSGGRGSSSHSLTSSQTVHFSSSSGLDGKVAKSYSSGGGPHVVLSSSPFKGREAGGGARNTIYGTSRYGSGYPYGGSGYYVDYRPFPYYYWPVPVQHGYYGSSTYANNESERPGGVTAAAPVRSKVSSTNETYHLLGDTTSIQAVMDALTQQCDIQSAQPDWVFVTITNISVPPERVVQWYRASSFALALDNYNNSAALISNMKDNNTAPLPLSSDTPLPSWLNHTFLDCLNETIGDALPLVEPKHKHKLTGGEIAGIVIGSITGAILIAVAVYSLIRHFTRNSRPIDQTKEKKKPSIPFVSRLTRNGKGKYSSVDAAQKQDHDTPSVYESDEKLAIPGYHNETSKRDMAGGSSTSLTSSTDSDEVTRKHPPFPFSEPKSTLDLQSNPASYPSLSLPEPKHS